MPVFPQSMSDFKPGETNIRSSYDRLFLFEGVTARGVYKNRDSVLCGLKGFVFSDLTRIGK